MAGKTIILSVGAILVIIAGVIGYNLNQPEQPVGSVARGGEYHATTTTSGTAAANYVIQTGRGTLGSIIVASSSGSTFTVLDANGTATTTIATLKASIAEGTFTFDRMLSYGLIITVPSGFNGQYITTYRE